MAQPECQPQTIQSSVHHPQESADPNVFKRPVDTFAHQFMSLEKGINK